LVELDISRCLFKRSKQQLRQEAIEALIHLVRNAPLTKLVLRGGGKYSLKSDIIPLIFKLITNKKLIYLDISCHQVGDQLAYCLRKVLQHNKSIKSLLLDENDTTIQGFKALKIAFERNTYITYFPYPYKDISWILKSEGIDQEAALKLFKDIEHIINQNSESIQRRPKLQKLTTESNKPRKLRNHGGTTVKRVKQNVRRTKSVRKGQGGRDRKTISRSPTIQPESLLEDDESDSLKETLKVNKRHSMKKVSEILDLPKSFMTPEPVIEEVISEETDNHTKIEIIEPENKKN